MIKLAKRANFNEKEIFIFLQSYVDQNNNLSQYGFFNNITEVIST